MEKTALIIYWHEGKILVTADNRQIGEFKPEQDMAVMVEKIGESLKTKELFHRIDKIVCPGGVLKPLKRGCYKISKQAAEEAQSSKYGRHIYNLLTKLNYEIGRKYNIPSIMLYPMSSDELLPLCKMTGNKNVNKYSRYHALEHRAGLTQLSEILNKRIEDFNCIAAFADELTSVAAYERGMCLDVNDCIGAEGPMGLTSSGDVPVAQIAEYFMQENCTYDEMERKLMSESGLYGYTGLTDLKQLDTMYYEDGKVQTACDAMAYQTAKWIGSSALVLRGQVDAVLLTGKAAQLKVFTELVKKRVERIAPVFIFKDLKIKEFMTKEAKLLGTYACPVYEY